MRVFTLPLVLFLGSCFISKAQFPAYQWVKKSGGMTGSEATYGNALTGDKYGNVINAGRFWNTIDFDPGPAVLNLSATGNYEDIYITKMDSMGTLLWAKTLGSASTETCTALGTDHTGNILVTGTFKDSCDLDPGPGKYMLYSNGAADNFVCKLSGAGNLIWAVSFGGSGDDCALSVVTDKSGNVMITGYYSNVVDFDPGPGTHNDTSLANTDIFVLKLDSAGLFKWARTFGSFTSPTGWDQGNDVNVDSSGNIYVTGDFQYSIDFDPGPAYYPQTANCKVAGFLLKLDQFGDFVFVRTFGGFSGTTGASVALDRSGNIFVAGQMGIETSTGDFDPNAGVYTLAASGVTDSYIVKLDPNANFRWAKNMGGKDITIPTSVATDRRSNVFVMGYFYVGMDADPSTSTHSLQAQGFDDIYITMLDSGGVFKGAGRLGEGSMDRGSQLFTNHLGAVYAGGYTMGKVDFDFSAATSTLNTPFASMFVLKMQETCELPPAPIDINPAAKKKVCLNTAFSLSVTATGTVSWYASQTGTNVVNTGKTFTSAGLPTGTYDYYAEAMTCGASVRTKITVSVTSCTGLAENTTLPALIIYPNPSAGITTVVPPGPAGQFKADLIDCHGKIIVLPFTIVNGSLQTDLSQLIPGVYTLRLLNNDAVMYDRVIVVK